MTLDADRHSIVPGMQDFKHIVAWQRAHGLAMALHGATRGFGRLGHAHLRAQLLGAAQSVAANIVEGCGAASSREFARFLDVSIKSANETEYHLLSARDLRLLTQQVWTGYAGEIVEIRKMTYTYRQRVLKGPAWEL